MKRFWILALVTTGMFLTLGTACKTFRTQLKPDGFDPNTPRYTAYNIWYEKPDNVWSTNYKAGNVIPAGTKVTDVKVGSKRNHPILAFTVPEYGTEFIIHYNQKHHGSLPFDTFKERMLTTQNFDQLTKGMTKDEIKAIKAIPPYICKGMSKKAAIVAFGYPPESATPSTNANAWKYWLHRWKTVYVRFDDKGKAVAEVQSY